MDGPTTSARISRWGVVVMVCALLIVGGTAALAIASVTSSHKRIVSFAVSGSLSGVALDVDDADVLIAGGGQRSVLGVQRTDRFAFGHDAEVQRSLAGDELRIRSRCPNAVPRACSVHYRVVVPDNVPVTVRTAAGTVSFRGYRGSARVTTRSGDIDIAGLLRLLAAGARGERRHHRERGMRATAADAALDAGLGAGVRAAGPLPGRGRERLGPPPRPRPRRGVRRAVRDPGPEQLGRRDGGGSSVIAALELDRRLERAAGAAAYLVVNVPIALLGRSRVLALVIGAALSVVWIGLPLLLGAAAACRWLVRLDRRAANRFLGTHIPPVPGGVPSAGNPWRRSLDVLSDRVLWRIVAILATKPMLIAVLCVVALVPLALLAEILSLGVQGVAGLGDDRLPGPVVARPRASGSCCWR